VGVNLAIHDRQEGRVILRFSMAALVGMLSLAVVGCGESAGPASLAYSPNEDVATKLEGKPKVQAQVAKLITDLFGPAPDRMRVPPEAPLPEGGARLASRVVVGAEPNAPSKAVIYRTVDADGSSTDHRIRGGYAIYREQCMHCHGASGDGNGPTGPFLWPPPRDYRLGVFKFTSTSGSGPDSKPTRDDLRRTVRLGIAETSMPAFESLLTPNEIEQVIDYVVFLSMRGEIENGLIYLGQDIEDSAAETDLAPEQAQEAVNLVFERWKAADANVLDPKVPRTPSSRESILRGLALSGREGPAVLRLPRPRRHGQRRVVRRLPLLRQGGLRRQPQSREDQCPQGIRGKGQQEMGRRLGRPAAARQSDARAIQGRPPAPRHLLAHRQGNQRHAHARSPRKPAH
jgi:mono/diheme cytochrome c family protein